MAAAALTTRLTKHIEYTNTCWLWKGSIRSDGYGQLTFESQKWAAHRFMYTMFRGPIPDGLHLDHLCMVKRCVNPGHLDVVTSAENMKRWGESITHCPKGHVRDGQRSSGRRYCKTCDRERNRAKYRAAVQP